MKPSDFALLEAAMQADRQPAVDQSAELVLSQMKMARLLLAEEGLKPDTASIVGITQALALNMTTAQQLAQPWEGEGIDPDAMVWPALAQPAKPGSP